MINDDFDLYNEQRGSNGESSSAGASLCLLFIRFTAFGRRAAAYNEGKLKEPYTTA